MTFMTPESYRTSKRRVIRIPGPEEGLAVVTGDLAPADNSLFFAEHSEAGVVLYATEIHGDRFRLSVAVANGDYAELVTSKTSWGQEAPYLHVNPPFGEVEVRYVLDAERNGAWTRIGERRLDLSQYILDAPVIEVDPSFYNSPFLHVEWVWTGDDADLEHFQVEYRIDQAWLVAIRTPERIAHVELEAPPEDEIAIRVRANGVRFGNSAYSFEETLTNEAADDGEGVGDDQLRGLEDHRRFTPNLCRNSSFELLDPTDGIARWDVIDAITDNSAWAEVHGEKHIFVTGLARQQITARISNTDIHSCSVQALNIGGTMRVVDLNGDVIDSVAIQAGLNSIEGFRVPSTHKAFYVELLAQISLTRFR